MENLEIELEFVRKRVLEKYGIRPSQKELPYNCTCNNKESNNGKKLNENEEVNKSMIKYLFE